MRTYYSPSGNPEVWAEKPEGYMTAEEYTASLPPPPAIEIPLNDLKAAKIYELKAARDYAEVQPIEYNGHAYDYDQKARERISAAIIALDLMGEDASIDWTTADNDDVPLTAADLRNIVAAVAARSNLLHIRYRELKAQVEEAGTADEVNAITFEESDA